MEDLWSDNLTQFARLICEIEATQELDLESLAVSMDLSQEDLLSLFERANKVFEEVKKKVTS